MTAAQKVFDVAELLEIIICQCVPHQIRELKEVARTWRDMITFSRAIKRASVKETLSAEITNEEAEESDSNLADLLWNAANITEYYSTSWIWINPTLNRVQYVLKNYLEGHFYYDVTIALPEASSLSSGRMNQYISYPPVADMTIGTCYWDPDFGDWQVPDNINMCPARNADGLKIKDLLDVRDALAASQTRHADDDDLDRVDTMIHATFQIQSVPLDEEFEHYRKLDSLYFNGPPPRHRKASDKPGSKQFQMMMRKDRELEWQPWMDEEEDKLAYQPDWTL